MSTQFNYLVAAAANPSFTNAVEKVKQDTKERIEESKFKANNIISMSSIMYFIYRKDVVLSVMNAVLVAISFIIGDNTTLQYGTILFSPLKVVQKIVFMTGNLIDKFLIDELKEDQYVMIIMKAIKYILMGVMLIGTW